MTKRQFMILYSQQFPEGDAETVRLEPLKPLKLKQTPLKQSHNFKPFPFQFSKHVFRTFDTDGDKKLDFREFMTALNMTARAGPQERLKWAFQMYDVDQSGEITVDECEVLVQVKQRNIFFQVWTFLAKTSSLLIQIS